jgi:Flp pilus assembly CpaF family ATPase
MHKRLLENLNLAALEHATEAEPEAGNQPRSPAEALDEMSVALNKDDRSTLVQELYDEVMGLGPLEPLLKDETINDILVNGPQAHLRRTRGQAAADRHHLPRRTPPSAHHRQDRVGRGPPRR